MLSKQKILSIIDDFSDFAQKLIGKRKNHKIEMPFVEVVEDGGEDDHTILQSTGAFSPEENKIYVFTNGREIADILRSFAHELVHAYQKQIGKISEKDMEEFSEADSVESSEKLWDVEEEANGLGGMLFRAYRDYVKNKIKNKKIAIKEGKHFNTKHIVPIMNESNIFDLYSLYLQKEKEKEEEAKKKEEKTKELIKKHDENRREILNSIKVFIRKEKEKEHKEVSLEYLDELAEELSRSPNSASYAIVDKKKEFHQLFLHFFETLFEKYGYEKNTNFIKAEAYEFFKNDRNGNISITIYPIGLAGYYKNNTSSGILQQDNSVEFTKPMCSISIRTKKEETVFEFDCKNIKEMYKKIKKIIKEY